MKKIITILIVIALMMQVAPLNVSANSNQSKIEFEDYKIVEFTEIHNVKLDKEWTIKFSGEVLKDKIQEISIDKGGTITPINYKVTASNEVTVNSLSRYEADSRYRLKISLKNGNKYSMYFNTISSIPSEDLKVELEVLRLVNIERAKEGLSPLKLGKELTVVAKLKSKDMSDNNYFDHISPTYGSPFEMMKQFGIKYNTAGENIAMGYPSAESVMIGWMNSPGHKANILEARFGTLGVGYIIKNGVPYWTQMFTN